MWKWRVEIMRDFTVWDFKMWPLVLVIYHTLNRSVSPNINCFLTLLIQNRQILNSEQAMNTNEHKPFFLK